MFTGIVEQTGEVVSNCPDGSGRGLVITCPGFFQQSKIGASLAINGVCLTLVKKSPRNATFALGPETLNKTNLGVLTPGCQVNLEKPMSPASDFSGHFVQGHVDGVGNIVTVNDDNGWRNLRISFPRGLAPLLVLKGSIAVDGVSLTIVQVKRNWFEVALIPHTLAVTTLKSMKEGDPVNLEGDILGKYVLRAAKIYFPKSR